MITTGSCATDWPDESKAPARTRPPIEGPRGQVTADGFESRAPSPPQRFGKDSGASAPAAVPSVPEYPEKPVGGLERSGLVRPHFLPSAGGNHRCLRPAPDCFPPSRRRVEGEKIRLFRSSARRSI